MEGSDAQGAQAHFNSVDDKFFDVFAVRFLAGRSFDAGDFKPGRTPVIVNRSFVREILGQANALGRRIRYRETEQFVREGALVHRSAQREGGLVHRSLGEGGWHEIVGVVEDFPRSNGDPTMFHPMTGTPHPVTLTIRAPSGIGLAASRLRDIALRLDPQPRVGRLRSLEEMYWGRDNLPFWMDLEPSLATVFCVAERGFEQLGRFWQREGRAGGDYLS